MALGSTQLLTEMSTGSISWDKKRPVRKADKRPPSCAVVTKSGSINFLEHYGSVQACNGTALPLPLGYSSVQNSWWLPALLGDGFPRY